jgi:hypothetical protein
LFVFSFFEIISYNYVNRGIIVELQYTASTLMVILSHLLSS